jgi:hypothetical protein
LLLITSFLVWKTKHVGATVNIVMLDTGLTKMGPENLKQVTTYPASMSATVKHYCASTMWHFPILESKLIKYWHQQLKNQFYTLLKGNVHFILHAAVVR